MSKHAMLARVSGYCELVNFEYVNLLYYELVIL
jgi:hypothetical protein